MDRYDGSDPGLGVLYGIGDQVEKYTFQGLGLEPYDRKCRKVYVELRARLLDQISNGVLYLMDHIHQVGSGQLSLCGVNFLEGIYMRVHRLYQTIGAYFDHSQYFLGLGIHYLIQIDQVDQ
tara:strand:+ start:355 stop:717 length:363 start_codon:yes stop_codon:yes gene_type:complete